MRVRVWGRSDCSDPTRISASSRSSDSDRCEPRLLPASAWISSTMTVRTEHSMSRPDCEVSRMNSDSGVVTSTCGGSRRMRLRSVVVVSPVRTMTRIFTADRPSAFSSSAIPHSGARRFFSMSLDRARSGETYNTWVWSGRPCSSPAFTNSSSAAKNAARVLPLPVGAAINVLRPDRIAGQASACAGVGPAN